VYALVNNYAWNTACICFSWILW